MKTKNVILLACIVLSLLEPVHAELFDSIEPSKVYEFRLLGGFSGEEAWRVNRRNQDHGKLKIINKAIIQDFTKPQQRELFEKDLLKLYESRKIYSRNLEKKDDSYLEWILFQNSNYRQEQRISKLASPTVLLERPLAVATWIRADGPPVQVSILLSSDGRNIRPVPLGVFTDNEWQRTITPIPQPFTVANQILGHRLFFHGLKASRTQKRKNPSVVSIALLQILVSHDRKFIPGNQYIFD